MHLSLQSEYAMKNKQFNNIERNKHHLCMKMVFLTFSFLLTVSLVPCINIKTVDYQHWGLMCHLLVQVEPRQRIRKVSSLFCPGFCSIFMTPLPLGFSVSLNTLFTSKSVSTVKVMQPSVAADSGSSNDEGDNEVGFATAVGQFDSLVDTIANERKGMIITEDSPYGGSSLLQLLQSRHGCGTYVSTLTQSQQIIKNDGVIFGPGKANSHVKSMESIPSKQCMSIIPPVGFGPSTLQVLLENNIIFSSKNTKPIAVRGWELKDFWEETSWPRDSSGTGVRYGLPVVEEEDLDELFRIQQMELQRRKRTRVGTEGGMDEKEVQKQTKVDERNPYVTQIVGVEGLAETIISKQQTGVVFVAMKSCRTCKGINPIFTKLARDQQKKSSSGGDLIFAKADASGAAGKALGRQLGVVAVPAFVLFRNGVRYGAVSASKLPSDRLDQAIMDLEAGKDFDESLAEDEDD